MACGTKKTTSTTDGISGGGPGVADGAGSRSATTSDPSQFLPLADLLEGAAGTATGGSMATGPVEVQCAKFGDLCQQSSECCSGLCNPSTNVCAAVTDACGEAGTPCRSGTACCELSCVDGTCSEQRCRSDGDTCSQSNECCGGNCQGGQCAALSLECLSTGNSCTESADCCSKLCANGVCDFGSSFCTQSGDLCSRAEECCTGVCNIADGATVGSCGAPPSGASNCSGQVDGSVCNGCGSCCSRLCAPYGDSGVSVCQPASGCHVNGDLCRSDSDCCGASGTGLPGEGNVVCDIEPGAPLGICRNPTGCNPQGNVCHFQDYVCSNSSSRNNCCSGTGNSGECQLDSLGIPRCNGLSAEECRTAGETCSSSSDCCDGVPCVPGDDLVLRCFDSGDPESTCVPVAGSCTIDADCCLGGSCLRPQGSTQGTCALWEEPSDGIDPGDPAVLVCALYGQSCSDSSECCNDVPCTNGVCKFNLQ